MAILNTTQLLSRDGSAVDQPNRAEIEATANLIAAAPELLESLDMLAGLLPVLCASFGVEDDFGLEVKVKSTGETRQMLFSEVIGNALAAVAKASGQNAGVLAHADENQSDQ